MKQYDENAYVVHDFYNDLCCSTNNALQEGHWTHNLVTCASICVSGRVILTG
jgi:hypothetical protein